MEEDEKKPSPCCLLVLYNSLFRRRPVNYSIPPSSPSIRTNTRRPIPIQPKSTTPNTFLSSDLDTMIFDHQQTKCSSSTNLLRASSGNVMLYANLGNLCAPPKKTSSAKEMEQPPPPSICRALSRRLDPEELKEMGNEEYTNGRYAEAVALYDRAIFIDPEKACYWSNKAAALIGLGRFLDAVEECREAIMIDACYFRAHLRLANLYLRLGEPKKAANHYKLAKNEASYDDISRAKGMQVLIGKCSEARNLRDWNILLKESQSAISAGADSSPQIFAYQAEAFLMLRRLEDAEESMIDAPKFETDASTKFFGAASNAYYLSVRAQVDLAAGKFESAVSLAQMATRIDPGSREIASVARKARSVASARSMGNNLFKASKFEEACLAYGDGLRHDPHNAILLCNRAACQSKLGQWKKAIEDCNVALNLRPKYNKARLRRADCNTKLKQWEASVKDYEVLVLEMSGDETMSKALKEAKEHLRRQLVEGITETANGSKAVHISTKDQFHDKSSGEFGGKRLLSMVGNCELSP